MSRFYKFSILKIENKRLAILQAGIFYTTETFMAKNFINVSKTFLNSNTAVLWLKLEKGGSLLTPVNYTHCILRWCPKIRIFEKFIPCNPKYIIVYTAYAKKIVPRIIHTKFKEGKNSVLKGANFLIAHNFLKRIIL